MQDNKLEKDYVEAGFWVRLAAYLIDSIIVSAGLLIFRLIFLFASDTFITQEILFRYSLADIILYIASALYFIILTYKGQRTIGKKLFNLQVISNDGGKPSLMDIIFRETVGRFLCGLFLGIGYILAGVDKEKRGLHDMLSDTKVIYTKKVKIYEIPVPSNVRTTTYDNSHAAAVASPAQPVTPIQEAPIQNTYTESSIDQVAPEQLMPKQNEADPVVTEPIVTKEGN